MSCDGNKEHELEIRNWQLIGFTDTLQRIDTIKLKSQELKKRSLFNGYLDDTTNFYRLDSVIAKNIEALEKNTAKISNKDFFIEMTARKIFAFENKPLTIYSIHGDLAPFTSIGGPMVFFTKEFGVIFYYHSHGRYTLNLNSVSRIKDKKLIKKVNLESLVREAKADTILFPLPPPVISQPELEQVDE